VNVFQGRINQGQAVMESLRVNLSEDSTREGDQANVYIRPNDISIDRVPIAPSSFEATVTRINRAGINAKLSLASKNKEEIRVDISMERLLELDLQLGDTVFVHPTKARVFVPDYTI
jgi:sulfate transport system ATP-binding protein